MLLPNKDLNLQNPHSRLFSLSAVGSSASLPFVSHRHLRLFSSSKQRSQSPKSQFPALRRRVFSLSAVGTTASLPSALQHLRRRLFSLSAAPRLLGLSAASESSTSPPLLSLPDPSPNTLPFVS
ncbi:SCP1-like small phosphatase 5 [Striga asiatica]|uniref:SCP1-like small phosphatase 5 n=1 Tax=Striga asiatica TaxID=4170 RepID=A0A5A7QGC6_STRAF|nr:SCP1-like small phosphatase 5 [Striga asiatica]